MAVSTSKADQSRRTAGVAIASFVTPTTTDLALVAAGSTSIKTAQIFGVFNLAYSVGALIGKPAFSLKTSNASPCARKRSRAR